MQTQHSDLVLTSSTNRLPTRSQKQGDLVQIGRCTYADWRRLRGAGLPWEIRRRVAEARILLAQASISRGTKGHSPGRHHGFTGESALVIFGLEPWWNNPDVMVRKVTRSGHRLEVPPVKVSGTNVPGVRFTQIRHHPKQLGRPLSRELREQLRRMGIRVGAYETSVHSGVQVAPAHLVVYDLCRLLHPLQAFHDVSMLLRYLSAWDSRNAEASGRRLTLAKQALGENLAQLGSVPGIRRTRAVLDLADAAIESPAESIVLWTLLTIVKDNHQISTQIPVTMGRHRFRIDVGIPSVKLAIEATGKGKFGDTSATAYEVASKFLSRQQALESLGWRVVNVTYEQAKALPTLMSLLRDVLSEEGIPTTVPNSLLWEAASPEVMARNRRF